MSAVIDYTRMYDGITTVLSRDHPTLQFAAMSWAGVPNNGVVQYYWNFSGNTEYHNTTGLWYNHGESDDNGAITYDGFWSNVFLVGTYNDARWFGWYECGEGVHVTEDGIPFILSEDKDAHDDDDFTSMVEEKMKEALTFSDDDDEYSFTVYKQDDCDCKCGRALRIATPLFSCCMASARDCTPRARGKTTRTSCTLAFHH